MKKLHRFVKRTKGTSVNRLKAATLGATTLFMISTTPPVQTEAKAPAVKGQTSQSQSTARAVPMMNVSAGATAAEKPVENKATPKARKAGGGQASFYHTKFDGRKTANGERYNHNALTAAHKTLPFGTKVKVTNVKNGRSVIVRINDRGPFIANRVIDLSGAAARQIGMINAGTAQVQLEILT